MRVRRGGEATAGQQDRCEMSPRSSMSSPGGSSCASTARPAARAGRQSGWRAVDERGERRRHRAVRIAAGFSDESPDPIRPGAQYAQRPGRGQLSYGSVAAQFRLKGAGDTPRRSTNASRIFDRACARDRSNVAPDASAMRAWTALFARTTRWPGKPSSGNELARAGIGSGPFARELIEARSPNTDFRAPKGRRLIELASSSVVILRHIGSQNAVTQLRAGPPTAVGMD